jgi:predicted nuclease of predicted toxin-antitoxin system
VRLLADECIRRSLVEGLRAAGHDVIWVRETMAGASDEAVSQSAEEDGRILLTADKDFGEIRVRLGRGVPGIILLRYPPRAWSAATDSLNRLLALAEGDLRGRVVVLSPGRARFRPLRLGRTP